MDQPTFDGINTYVVSRAAAEHGYKVALSGIGGDELFGGYPSFVFAPWLARSRRIHRFLPARTMAAAAAAVVSGERGRKLRRWVSSEQVEGDAYDLVRELFGLPERELLLRTGGQSPSSSGVSSQHSFGFGEVSRRELTQYMRNVLLRDTDCFGMACSLEVREPFLHTALVEFLLTLPDAWKARRPPKALLREAFSDVLPASTVRRPKRGFVLPFH